MRIIFNLAGVPELKEFDIQRRRRALLDWHIELWRSWSFYFQEAGVFLAVILTLERVRILLVGDMSWHWEMLWTGLVLIVAITVRNSLVYWRKRQVLAQVLKRDEFRR